jgi:hypothetical protein
LKTLANPKIDGQSKYLEVVPFQQHTRTGELPLIYSGPAMAASARLATIRGVGMGHVSAGGQIE